MPSKNKHRKLSRLKDYDYSSEGMYFVTICTHERRCLFGDIKEGEIVLNDAGWAAVQCWNDIPKHFPHTRLDEFIVMPNHVHGILCLGADHVGANNYSPLQSKLSVQLVRPRGTSKTIGSMIRGFKIGVTKWIRQNKNMDLHNVWQRNYYDHIIRNDSDLNHIRKYIADNPLKWAMDKNNPYLHAGGS